jgi:hypothetical protein
MTKILPPYADLGATFVDTTTHFNERTFPLSMSITSGLASPVGNNFRTAKGSLPTSPTPQYNSFMPAFMENHKSKVRLMKEDVFQERETNRQLKSGGGQPITTLPKNKYNCNLRAKAAKNALSIDQD